MRFVNREDVAPFWEVRTNIDFPEVSNIWESSLGVSLSIHRSQFPCTLLLSTPPALLFPASLVYCKQQASLAHQPFFLWRGVSQTEPRMLRKRSKKETFCVFVPAWKVLFWDHRFSQMSPIQEYHIPTYLFCRRETRPGISHSCWVPMRSGSSSHETWP